MKANGNLGTVPEAAFLRELPPEKLYDLEKDSDQVRNLEKAPKSASEPRRHREILDRWIKEADDKGQKPESKKSLAAICKRWGSRCANPEYDVFKTKKNMELDQSKPSSQ